MTDITRITELLTQNSLPEPRSFADGKITFGGDASGAKHAIAKYLSHPDVNLRVDNLAVKADGPASLKTVFYVTAIEELTATQPVEQVTEQVTEPVEDERPDPPKPTRKSTRQKKT